MKYSRQNPSEEYLSLGEQYRLFHSIPYEWEKRKVAPEDIFVVDRMQIVVLTIKKLMEQHDCRSIINFGCGKPDEFFKYKYINKSVKKPSQHVDRSVSPQYDSVYNFLGEPYVKMYDPGIEEVSVYPDFPAEIVVCTDVLEHIPAQDIPWFLDELLKLTTKVLYITICLSPALTILPDGRNAHVCIKPRDWWRQRIFEAEKRASHHVRVEVQFRYPNPIRQNNNIGLCRRCEYRAQYQYQG
jgi:hypothetical protein|tara:strand:+ start:50 stop:772 length:723 start_codon:yes stop_codon:yes gene_type:complete